MNDLHVEFRPLKNDDFSKRPSCFKEDFNGEECVLIRHDNCGMILNEDDRPYYYFHNMNEFSSRWAGLIRLGETPLSLQSDVCSDLLAQNEEISEYQVICDDPLTYGVKTLSGRKMEFSYNEDGCQIKEGDILDLKGEWFENGLICHLGSEYNIPFIHLPVHLKGKFKGKDIEMLACIDRIFSPVGKEKEIIKNATGYISSYCSGIREDGRKEWFIGLICHDNGKGLGIYYLEGEEPIISGEVVNEGVWEKLPYVDDGTVVCVDNVWKFGGMTFHVLGKYGSKGFSATPNFERHGQSQVFGSWYAGDKEYKHRIWNTFSENMNAYYDNMKQRGFKVK